MNEKLLWLYEIVMSYVSYDISFVKIKGFLWHGTESDWYKCYIIWVNETTYTQT